jgi:hypothetical protein
MPLSVMGNLTGTTATWSGSLRSGHNSNQLRSAQSTTNCLSYSTSCRTTQLQRHCSTCCISFHLSNITTIVLVQTNRQLLLDSCGPGATPVSLQQFLCWLGLWVLMAWAPNLGPGGRLRILVIIMTGGQKCGFFDDINRQQKNPCQPASDTRK